MNINLVKFIISLLVIWGASLLFFFVLDKDSIALDYWLVVILSLVVIIEFVVFSNRTKTINKEDNDMNFLPNFKVWAFALLTPIAVVIIKLFIDVIYRIIKSGPTFSTEACIVYIGILIVVAVPLIFVINAIWKMSQID